MARRPFRFTQGDVTRAMKGAEKAGRYVAEAFITRDGDIRLILGTPQTVPSLAILPLDKWMAGRARAS